MKTRWTLRVRLTVVYGCLFFLAGAIVLGVTYVLLRQTLAEQPGIPVIVDGVVVNKRLDRDIKASMNDLTAAEWATVLEKERLAEQAAADYRNTVLRSLLNKGSIALGGVGLIAVAAGWVVAGRVLRPLGQITATARKVVDRNLHERIALGGPRDEVRVLADTFDEMLERLDHSFDSQRRFVANASHELKTPLAINRTAIEVALGDPGTPPQMRRLGETLLRVNARHERLVDGLLALARSEGALTEPVPVDLASIVEAALHGVDPSHLTVERSLLPATTKGDPILLEQLTRNLVHNAVSYNVADGWVSVRTEAGDSSVTLTVANTGPVILAPDVPGLFEPFRRLSGRTGSDNGSGLGLSIVRSVATAHGGQAAAAARAGGGLVVSVSLPRYEAGPVTGRDDDARRTLAEAWRTRPPAHPGRPRADG